MLSHQDYSDYAFIGWLDCCDRILDLCKNERDPVSFTQGLLEVLHCLNTKALRDKNNTPDKE